MASTIQLSRTIGLTQNFVRNAPLTFIGSTEPALSNADWVRQFMLAAPFTWSWNQGSTQFTCVAGQQDYVVSLADFGYLQKAVVDDPSNGDECHELEVQLQLAVETQPNLPTKISPQSQTPDGNVSFRLMPPPDTAYIVYVDYQKAAATFGAVTDTWSPIPDFLSYLYNQGMLAKAYEYLNDSRFGGAMQLFLRQVIAANAGLDDTQVNIFLPDRVNTDRTASGAAASSQMGRQARGMF